MKREQARSLVDAVREGVDVPPAAITQALQATGDIPAPRWTPGTWWRAPDDQKFRAYYLNLRTNYHMPALEAISYARQVFRQFPAFMNDPAGSLRRAISEGTATC